MTLTKENLAYESKDAHVPHVLAGVAVLVAGIAFSLIVAAFVYRGEAIRPVVSAARTSFKNGPENAPGIVRDWREQDRLVREHLESYTWVDREKGLVRIPIERAMELMARDAELPARKKP